MLSSPNIHCVIDVDPAMCKSCLSGKMSKIPFVESNKRSSVPFSKVHSDVWGPCPYSSLHGYKYFVTFTDDCTRFLWVFPLINKSEVYSKLYHFYEFVRTQFGVKIQILQSGGGGEFLIFLKTFFYLKVFNIFCLVLILLSKMD